MRAVAMMLWVTLLTHGSGGPGIPASSPWRAAGCCLLLPAPLPAARGSPSPSVSGGGRLHHALARGLRVRCKLSRLFRGRTQCSEAEVLVLPPCSPGTSYPASSLLMVLLFW